jgi:mannose-6-phosphate isomerase-like protein (cupin superfamily)
MREPSVHAAYELIDFDGVPAVDCPCGTARRALADVAELPFTLHRTDISVDARVHYHKRLTEVYYILECAADAQMELDGQRLAVKRGLAIRIPPGVRHRAIGAMQVLVIASPKFDPQDEWFD